MSTRIGSSCTSCEYSHGGGVGWWGRCRANGLTHDRYHHLNHHAMFGGGYKGGAVSIMKGLLSKYGRTKS